MIRVDGDRKYVKATLATLVIAGGSSLSSAAAFAGGDIGGDCCVDLEERVAEMEATTARKGNRRVSLRISGHVNRAILFISDGDDSDTFVVDNHISPSQFRFTGKAAIRPGWSAGFATIFKFSTADTLSVSLADGANDNDDGNSVVGGIDLLDAYWWIRSNKYGSLSVGQRTHATFGITQNDLSGTLVAAHSSKAAQGAAIRFRETSGTLSFAAIGARVAPYFSVRGDIVRYDSPSIRGFRASASWGEDDIVDAAIRYFGKVGDFRVLAGVGYSDDEDETNDFTQVAGSASFFHMPTGLSLTVAGGDRDTAGSSLDQHYYYVKVALKRKYRKIGATAISFDFVHHDEHAVANEDFEQWGVQIVQNIDAAAMELYAAYSNSSLNNPTTSYQDIDLFMAGAKIKF